MRSWQTQDNEFIATYENFLAANTNKRIFVLSLVPLLDRNPFRDLRFVELGIRRGGAKIDNSYQEANKLIELITDKYGNASFIRLDELTLFHDAPFY